MSLNIKQFILASTAGLSMALSVPALADDVTEEEISMQDLPAAVANTMQSELGEKQPKEVEKISYEGIPVLFEAEYPKEREMYEIYVYPNGDLAARHSHEEEEEGKE